MNYVKWTVIAQMNWYLPQQETKISYISMGEGTPLVLTLQETEAPAQMVLHLHHSEDLLQMWHLQMDYIKGQQ